ncbi:G-protein coupled receptor Mth2-like [Nylanderia fulva]|uniref:G-protein coupled receptor Mth2-like n=1 Tax=Nylanderia fulva TaxID=613905 RepID=UPI0010FB75B9|nr:G-protein coupled receptor Mth2-like [Nylanderia fulva]
MCGKTFAFWCCVLLLLVISSKTQRKVINNEETDDNLMIRYELDELNSTTKYGDKIEQMRYDLCKKFINNMQYDNMQFASINTSTSNDDEDDDSIQYKYKSDTHFIQKHKDDKQIPMESRIYFINAKHERNFTLQEVYENLKRIEDKNDSMLHEFFRNFNKSNIVPYEICENFTCIAFCCSLGDRLIDNKYISEKRKYFFPNFYGYTNLSDSLQSKNKNLDELFRLVVYDSCQKNHHLYESYNFMIFDNGSLYLPHYKIFDKSTSYCLAVVDEDKVKVIICSKTSFVPFDGSFSATTNNKILSINDILICTTPNIMCILFLLLIILVYSILPELRNAFGFILRNYSGALFIAYVMWIVNFLINAEAVQYSVCITIAFFTYYSFLASTLWLTVMSFDMWCTFRKICSQKNRQREKKKLMFYAIFAWGFSFIFAVACIIMDFVSEDLPQILRPKFRAGNCWFAEKETLALYYYGFKSICVISSIYLSISTGLKIAHYDKDTSIHLTDSESKHYNNNKKWFNLYLKLFIMQFIIMGIKWIMKTALIIFEDKSNYILHAINLMDVIQNLCTFIILVWKKKIKQKLWKRLDLLLKGQSGTNSTSSIFTQKKTSSCRQKCHTKSLQFKQQV